MKNKNNILYIVLAVVVLLLIALLFYYYNTKEKKYKWYDDYDSKKEQPYQVKYLRTLLPTLYPDKKYKEVKFPLEKYLDTVTVPTNYVYIGSALYLNDEAYQSLLGFVENGNTAFISTKEFPEAFNDSIFIKYTSNSHYISNIDTLLNYTDTINLDQYFNDNHGYLNYYDSVDIIIEDTAAYRRLWTQTIKRRYNHIKDSSAYVNFTHPNLKLDEPYLYKSVYIDTVSDYYWKYIDTTYFNSNLNVIGNYQNDKVNFIRIKYGKGYFYLHSLPKVFTNYYLIDKKGYDYTKKAFGHLKEGAILYDEYNRHYRYESNNNTGPNNSISMEQSPLHYILAQREYRWAWYTLLSLGILYMLFKVKREQRIIPVLIPNTNSSLEFIKTIGTIYLNEKNHKRLVYQEMGLFLSHIRNRYRVSTKDLDNKLIKQIIQLSEIEEEKVKSIFTQFEKISKQSSIKDEDLITFYKSMRYFYKHSK